MRESALDDGAGIWIARFDGKRAVDGREGTFGRVEAEVRLALLRVKAVTGEAVVAEDGADVAIEVQLARRVRGGGQEGRKEDKTRVHGGGEERSSGPRAFLRGEMESSMHGVME